MIDKSGLFLLGLLWMWAIVMTSVDIAYGSEPDTYGLLGFVLGITVVYGVVQVYKAVQRHEAHDNE